MIPAPDSLAGNCRGTSVREGGNGPVGNVDFHHAALFSKQKGQACVACIVRKQKKLRKKTVEFNFGNPN